MALNTAERAKRRREKLKTEGALLLRTPLSQQENEKLKSITEFYGWPNQNLSETETVQLMIHRFYAEVETKREQLGKCQHCNEQLPAGCAKLKPGGLFKGDSNCHHTTNRESITNLKLEPTQ